MHGALVVGLCVATLGLENGAAAPSEVPAVEGTSGSEAHRLDVVAEGPEGPVPAWKLWTDYVRLRRPQRRGTGLLIAGGATAGIGLIATIAGAFSEDQTTPLGIPERLFFGASMILTPIGGYLRGRDDAFVDATVGRRRQRAAGLMAVGWALAGIGAIAGVVNEVFWWQCHGDEAGPYFVAPPEDVFFQETVCRGVARPILVSSSLLVSGGLGLGTWGLKYRRDGRIYERAVFAVRPRLDRGGLGLGLVGRF